MSYSSCSCFCLLDRTIQICVSCFRAVQIWFFEYNSLILTTGCSTWHLMAKNSLRIWELELFLSTKMAEAIRSSVTPWNWVTVQWPGSYRDFPRRVSLGTGLARVDQRSWVLVLCVRCRSWLQKTDTSAASIALEVVEVEGQLVSAQTIRQTLQQVGLHGCHPRRKPLLKLAHKKACKNSLLKTTWPRAWITVLCSDELMSCGLMSLR